MEPPGKPGRFRLLGERESGTERLEQAVGACRAALEELTREHAPLDSAATQNNLDRVLQVLEARRAESRSAADSD